MYVRVRVKAGARKEQVTQVSDTEYLMSVREPAERNLANTRIRELLAVHTGVQKEQVRIVTGHRSPTKIFAVG
jgi:uncharacterized protein YggU (UPF0235/DUF167 family)